MRARAAEAGDFVEDNRWYVSDSSDGDSSSSSSHPLLTGGWRHCGLREMSLGLNSMLLIEH